MAEAHDEGQQGIVEATLAYVARSLVTHPEDVEISASRDERGLVLRLIVNPEDMGRIIGKQGRTARALRSVVRAAGAKAGEGVQVQIVDRVGGESPAAADDVAAADGTGDSPEG